MCRDTEEGSCDGEIKGGTNGGRSKRTFPKGEEEILFHRQKKRRLQCLNLKLGKTYIFQLGIQCSLFNPISLLPGHIGPKMEWNGHPGSVRKKLGRGGVGAEPHAYFTGSSGKGCSRPTRSLRSRYVASCNRRQVRIIPFPLSPSRGC